MQNFVALSLKLCSFIIIERLAIGGILICQHVNVYKQQSSISSFLTVTKTLNFYIYIWTGDLGLL